MSRGGFEATDLALAFKQEVDPDNPTDVAMRLLQKAREQIERARMVQKSPSGAETQIDYGDLFKGCKPNDLSKLRPSIKQRPTKFQRLPVTLADLYEKREKSVRLVIDRLCNQCNGKRSQLDRDFTCALCNGRGQITSAIGGLDFAVPYQRTTKCGPCCGEGIVVPEADRCWQCLGAGVLSEPVVVKVPLSLVILEEVGKRPIVLEQQGDVSCNADEKPGNLEFNLELIPHPSWALVGDYFYCIKAIPVLHALCGRSFEVPFCDTTFRGACKNIIRDGQLVYNKEKQLLIRIQFIYPDELLQVSDLGEDLRYAESNSDVLHFELATETMNNYFFRHWGNRRTELVPLLE